MTQDEMIKIAECEYAHHERAFEPLLSFAKIVAAKERNKVTKERKWVGLTDEERQDIALEVPIDAVLITEAKLKKKNGFAEEKNT